jgi:hypothetical protein
MGEKAIRRKRNQLSLNHHGKISVTLLILRQISADGAKYQIAARIPFLNIDKTICSALASLLLPCTETTLKEEVI